MWIFGGFFQKKARFGLRDRFKTRNGAQGRVGWMFSGVFFKLLVGARGFEPPTSRSQTERTTRLCYAPSHTSFKRIRQACILGTLRPTVKFEPASDLKTLASLPARAPDG